MVYSLLEGLTALAAFGILIMGNERLCIIFKSSIEEDNRELVKFWKNKYSARFIYLAIHERIGNFLPIIGVLYLAGVSGHIIMNSEAVIINQEDYMLLLKLCVSSFLVFLIIVPQYPLFDALGNEPRKIKRIELKALCTMGYFGFFFCFVYTLNFLFLFLCFVHIMIATAVLIPLGNSLK